MSFFSRHARLLALAVACAALGAGVGAIATAGATTSSKPSPSATAPTWSNGSTATKAHRRAGWMRRLGGAVHADAVVATPQGFRTITVDRGYVESVSGNSLALREGTARATYRTVTVTLPSTVKVRNNKQPSSLSGLSKGEHVIIVQAPKRSFVIARS